MKYERTTLRGINILSHFSLTVAYREKEVHFLIPCPDDIKEFSIDINFKYEGDLEKLIELQKRIEEMAITSTTKEGIVKEYPVIKLIIDNKKQVLGGELKIYYSKKEEDDQLALLPLLAHVREVEKVRTDFFCLFALNKRYRQQPSKIYQTLKH